MSKHLGLPYMGSKSKLANRILALIPAADHFYDLFAGGCSVSHCAMLSRKYKHIHISDITDIPQVFMGALQGKYDNEDRWISRADFFRLKDSDPWVRLCWSFGNDLKSYLYSREVEPFKKALHWAVYYKDPQPLREFGYDVTAAMDIEDRHARWIEVKHICSKLPVKKELRLQSMERNVMLGTTPPDYKVTNRPCKLRKESDHQAITPPTQKRTSILRASVPYLQSFQTANHTRGFSIGDKMSDGALIPEISVAQKSYDEVEILPNSVVYCDIPYKSTSTYGRQRFDHERFYEWCRRQTQPTFISEYSMPDDFKVIAEFAHTTSKCATKTNKTVERVFVHESQIDIISKTTLF